MREGTAATTHPIIHGRSAADFTLPSRSTNSNGNPIHPGIHQWLCVFRTQSRGPDEGKGRTGHRSREGVCWCRFPVNRRRRRRLSRRATRRGEGPSGPPSREEDSSWTLMMVGRNRARDPGCGFTVRRYKKCARKWTVGLEGFLC